MCVLLRLCVVYLQKHYAKWETETKWVSILPALELLSQTGLECFRVLCQCAGQHLQHLSQSIPCIDFDGDCASMVPDSLPSTWVSSPCNISYRQITTLASVPITDSLRLRSWLHSWLLLTSNNISSSEPLHCERASQITNVVAN